MELRYGLFCPVAKAAEVIMGRWTPLILCEMMMGSERFGDIQNGVPLMSRSLLSRRLKEMELSGLIQRVPQPGGRGYLYRLTESGNALRPLIDQLAAWGSAWRLPGLDERDNNVAYMMWILRRRFAGRLSSASRAVLHFDFRNVSPREHKLRSWWMLLRDDAAELCNTDMGFEADLTVHADLAVFTRVICGIDSLHRARKVGDIGFTGNAALQAEVIDWLEVSEPPQLRIPVVPVAPKPARTMIPAA